MRRTDEEILKVVTENDWTTEEMCAEMDTFNKEELPRLNKIVDGAKGFLKECGLIQTRLYR